MFAVIKTGGKQYKVTPNYTFKIEMIEGEAGTKVEFNEVLMLNNEIGTPLVAGAIVTGEIIDQLRDKKILVFKKKRRQNYRRKNGHRQSLTHIRITSING